LPSHSFASALAQTTQVKNLLLIFIFLHQINIWGKKKALPTMAIDISVLEKNGFVFSGIVQDHEIGDAREWTLL
jgi:hypothetical protein